MAGELDDLVVGSEDRVGQPVVAQELSDVLDRVQRWGPWRQVEKRDAGRDLEHAGAVPSGLIEDTAWAPGLTSDEISSRCHGMAWVSHLGRTRAAPAPRAGQMAPKM